MDEQSDAFARSMRHRWEMPMVWIAVILSILGLVLSFGLQAADISGALSDLSEEDRASLMEFGEIGTVLIFAPIFIFILRFFMAGGVRANGVRVGPTQFPELWAAYQALAQKIGLARLPNFYVVMGQGVVNAYALSCNRRHKFVVMHAEIAHLIHSNPRIVDFVLAHELAHHKLGHTSLWRTIIAMIPGALVLPGRALTRAQEYSADRLAVHFCPDCLDGVSFLGVGPFMAGQVNNDSLYQQAVDDDRSLWVRLHNILSDHAVLVKRFKAIKDMKDKGPGVHGQMF